MEEKKLITPNTVLNGRGNYSSDSPTSYWDVEIPLVVGETLNGLSYRVEICEVAEDYVAVNVYKVEYNPQNGKDETIFKYKKILNDFSHYYIDNYSYSSGSYDDFVSYRGEFAIQLKQSFAVKIDRLKGRIDEGIEAVKCMLDGDESYVEVEKKLKTLLFRATDERYGKRIVQDNNISAIDEKNNILEKLDIINRVIEDIAFYRASFSDFIKDAYIHGINKQEYVVLFPYLNMIAEDYSTDIDLDPDRLRKILGDMCSHGYLSNVDRACFSYVLLLIYARTRYYFRAKSVALDLKELLKRDNCETIPRRLAYECHYEIAKLLNRICDRKGAMEAYKKAAECIKSADMQKAAYAMAEYCKINSVFPDDMRETVDAEQIKREYKEYANIILSKVNYKFIKIDEVEFTSEFVRNFVFVLEETEETIDKVGDIHLIYQRWSIMQEILEKKYKIRWKTPKEMNPNMMFD